LLGHWIARSFFQDFSEVFWFEDEPLPEELCSDQNNSVLAILYSDLTVYKPLFEIGQEGKSWPPSKLKGMFSIFSATSAEKTF
jgi:hypothetical protein